MGLYISLKPKTLDIAKQVGIQSGKTVTRLITECVEAMFSGEVAYIVLTPSPSLKHMDQIKEAIAKILPMRTEDEKTISGGNDNEPSPEDQESSVSDRPAHSEGLQPQLLRGRVEGTSTKRKVLGAGKEDFESDSGEQSSGDQQRGSV